MLVPAFLSSDGDCTTGRDGGQDSHGAHQGSYQVTDQSTGWCASGAGAWADRSVARHKASYTIRVRPSPAPDRTTLAAAAWGTPEESPGDIHRIHRCPPPPQLLLL